MIHTPRKSNVLVTMTPFRAFFLILRRKIPTSRVFEASRQDPIVELMSLQTVHASLAVQKSDAVTLGKE